MKLRDMIILGLGATVFIYSALFVAIYFLVRLLMN